MPFDKNNPEFARIAQMKSSSSELRAAITPELKVLLKVSKESLIPALMRISSLTYPELKILEKDDEAPAIDIYIARCLVKGISKGDPYFLQFIFDRILGKSREVISEYEPNIQISIGPYENN